MKKERQAVILAHYYVDGEVQEIADYVGDSFYLSRLAVDLPQQTILFCGVSFMGESAKILSPEKTVLLPDKTADCPMARMGTVEEIQNVQSTYPDLATVCYINSTAALKAQADVCVTSSNALKIIRQLPQQFIYFIPDQHLGRYIAGLIPEKTFIYGDGFCYVHTSITREALEGTKRQNPQAITLAHPECPNNILDLADYIGSTSSLIKYASQSDEKEFIICSEPGVLHPLKKNNPDKLFYQVPSALPCQDMKKINLEKIIFSLETMANQVEVEESARMKALKPLSKMLELSL